MKGTRKYRNSVFRNIFEQPYHESIRLKLYNSTKGNLDLIQRLSLQRSLPVHNGCVNCICWNDSGEFLLSGSDDQHLVISHAYNYKMLTNYKTSHRANIFSAKFLPCSGDTNIISCSGDGIILFTDLLRPSETQQNQFNCHVGTTYEIATVPNDPYTFLSCGEDYTVRCYDLRIKEKCNKPDCKDDVLITCQRAVTALTVNSIMPYQMAIGCSDSTVRLYDRRMLGTKSAGFHEPKNGAQPLIAFTAPGMEDRSYRITSLGFSPEGDDVLVSYSSEHLYMFNVKDHLGVEFEPNMENIKDNEVIAGTDKPSSFPPVRRLRLRGDWSDTGPDARPEREARRRGDVAQARPTLHATLMQRMTDVLSRMLNDPATRAALSHGGEEDTFSEDGNNRPRAEANEEAPDRGVVSVAVEGLYQNEAEQRTTPPPVPEPPTQPTTSATDEPLPLPSFESTYSTFTLIKNSINPESSASTSAPTSASTSASPSTSSSLLRRNESLSSLSDQLFSMRNGFIEKHGIEPMVNLTYSEQSSTAARISMSVADEVNREQVSTDSAQGSSSDAENSTIEVLSDVSSSSSFPQNNISEAEVMSEGEDEFGIIDSEEEMEITETTPNNDNNDNSDNNDNNDHEFAKLVQNAKTSDSNTSDDDYMQVRRPPVKMKFTGHRNARTMIKEATFWGKDYVLSGSDCGHVFIWDRYSAKLVMLLEADHHVVNCIQPHPFLPMLATSGIDYDVKLWAPIQDEPCFDTEMAEELMKRNEVMLEETKDTITVPASFMIRMLACLNQIRRGNTSRQRMRRRESREGGSE